MMRPYLFSCLGWIALLGAWCLPPQGHAADKWVPLFDGQTLNGWEGDPKYWRVDGGASDTYTDSPCAFNFPWW